jgi:endonuclease YncB( thermonuclease family)
MSGLNCGARHRLVQYCDLDEGSSMAQRGIARLRSQCRHFGGVLAVALVTASAAIPAHAADEMMGKAVRVPSGDTLVVDSAAGDTEIRLADIGAPQGGDYYAPPAATLLSNMVLGHQVRVTITGRSGPGRVFGRVYVGDLDVVLALVQRGAAWVCWEYAADTGLMPYENDAIRHQRGLWLYTTPFDARIKCRQRPPAEHPISKP